MVKFTETESRMVFSRGGWGEREFSFDGDSFSWESEDILEMEGGDGCIAMWGR